MRIDLGRRDVNKPLPFKDHSVDFVMAAHSLEYADNLTDALMELYRVCRHKAIVCMVVPYAHVSCPSKRTAKKKTNPAKSTSKTR